MAIFTGFTPASDYGCILNVGVTGGQVGLTNVLGQVQDAYGHGTPLSLSTIAINIARSGYTFSLDGTAVTAQAVDINSMCLPNPIALGTSAITVPRGTTSDRTGGPVDGMIRYNTDIMNFEGYVNGSWLVIPAGSSLINSIVGTANQINVSGTTSVTLSLAPNVSGITSLTAGNIEIAVVGTNQINTLNNAPIVFNVDIALENKALTFFDSTGIGFASIEAPSGDFSGNVTYSLPPDAPAINGYVLSSTTAGVMSWVANSAGSVVSVSGTSNQIDSTGGASPVLSLSSTVLFPGTAAIDNGAAFTFFDSTGVGYASLKAPAATYSSNIDYSLPVAPPALNGYVLSATTAGVMSWIPASSGTVTSVSATLPLISSGGVAPVISMQGLIGLAQGDLIYGDAAANTFARLAKDANATRYLSNQGTSNGPSWAQIALSTGVNGILPGANGGTGVANTGSTITIGGNVTFSGAHTFTGTLSADTSVTFPTSGTLSTSTGTVTSITAGTNLTGGTITASGTIALSATPTVTSIAFSPTTGGIVGTATNDSAGAGYVGEFISSVIASGSATAVAINTPVNLTSISLTAGDWDVWGNFSFVSSGTGSTNFAGWLSSTSATLPDASIYMSIASAGGAILTNSGFVVPQQRFSLAGTTTIYISVYNTAASGSGAACGGIYARRVR